MFQVAVAMLGVVSADVSLGYRYQVPHTSYGVPSYQHSLDNNYNTGYQTYYGHSGQKSQPITAIYQRLHPSGYQKAEAGAYSTANAGYRYSGNYQQPSYQSQYQTKNSYQSQYQTSFAQQYQDYYNLAHQQPAQIFKHFYVHEAPEEPEVPKVRQPVVFPAPQKHYKIIFIKTPSEPAAAPQFIPVPQQNEEKTIVYVLVKKPEEAQDIVLPKLVQKEPAKPEVYFIKYNNKGDSQSVINNIVSDYSKGHGEYSAGADSSYNAQSVQGSDKTQDYSTNVETDISGESQVNVAGGSSVSSFALGQGIESNSSNNQGIGLASGEQSGAVAQSVASSGDNQTLEGFVSPPTSQGVPHVTYGLPNFRNI